MIARDGEHEAWPAPAERFKILVPIDGTRLSKRILSVVHWVLDRRQAELTLLSVIGRHEPPYTVESRLDAGAEYLDWRRLLRPDERERVHFALRVGDAVNEIIDFTEDYEPTFIAMATHGRTGIDRIRRGSVTEAVLRRSRFPVLACTSAGLEEVEKPRPLALRRILVPLDGSERAMQVLPLVTDFARLYGSAVTLLHAIDAQLSALGLPGSIATATEAEAALEPARLALAWEGIQARVVSVPGPAGSAVLEAAKDEGTDLIALTTHGRSGLARLFYGSVAEHVLRASPCPVLVKRALAVPLPAHA